MFKLMLSLLAVSAVMISCSDDDDDTLASQVVAGKYAGKIEVSLQPGATTDATINLVQTGDKVKMELTESSFNALFESKISIENVVVAQSGDKYTFTGAGKVVMKGAPGTEGTPLDIKITGQGVPSDLTLIITVPFTPTDLTITFKGARK